MKDPWDDEMPTPEELEASRQEDARESALVPEVVSDFEIEAFNNRKQTMEKAIRTRRRGVSIRRIATYCRVKESILKGWLRDGYHDVEGMLIEGRRPEPPEISLEGWFFLEFSAAQNDGIVHAINTIFEAGKEDWHAMVAWLGIVTKPEIQRYGLMIEPDGSTEDTGLTEETLLEGMDDDTKAEVVQLSHRIVQRQKSG